MTADTQPERSVGELLSALAQDTSVLMRQELNLAKAEIAEKAKIAGANAALIATGGALGLAGLLALLTAVIVALSAAVPLWASALIVGVVLMVAAYGLVSRGLTALKRIEPIPERTIDTLKADAAWIKERAR